MSKNAKMALKNLYEKMRASEKVMIKKQNEPTRPKRSGASKKALAKLLESGITECLGGPGGDPDSCHEKAAAIMALVLIEEGFEDMVDKDTIDSVRGANVDEYDFMADVVEELNEYEKEAPHA